MKIFLKVSNNIPPVESWYTNLEILKDISFHFFVELILAIYLLPTISINQSYQKSWRLTPAQSHRKTSTQKTQRSISNKCRYWTCFPRQTMHNIYDTNGDHLRNILWNTTRSNWSKRPLRIASKRNYVCGLEIWLVAVRSQPLQVSKSTQIVNSTNLHFHLCKCD